jgi:ribosomal protein L5
VYSTVIITVHIIFEVSDSSFRGLRKKEVEDQALFCFGTDDAMIFKQVYIQKRKQMSMVVGHTNKMMTDGVLQLSPYFLLAT